MTIQYLFKSEDVNVQMYLGKFDLLIISSRFVETLKNSIIRHLGIGHIKSARANDYPITLMEVDGVESKAVSF